MAQLVLFQYLRHDREGILPVDTFSIPGRATAGNAGVLDDINGHLEDILSRFVEEPLEVGNYWVGPKDEFDPEEYAGYGVMYAVQQNDSRLALPKNPYQAAVELVKYILHSESWEENVTMSDIYTVTEYAESDIPATEPEPAKLPALTDPRYQNGDILVSSAGDSGVAYAGVLVRPRIDPLTDESWEWVDARTRNAIYVGLGDRSFVKLSDLNEFPMNDVKVHPLPSAAVRHVKKGIRWFALHREFKKLEGYGTTQKAAKRDLALKILLHRLND